MVNDLSQFTDHGYKVEHTIPFARYVGQEFSDQTNKLLYFPNFFKLPYELRLLIYEELDIPALYALMHASSTFRWEVNVLVTSLYMVSNKRRMADQ
jgi:hypothetical protein